MEKWDPTVKSNFFFFFSNETQNEGEGRKILFDFQQMATLNIYVLIFLFGDTAEMFQ